MHLGESFELFVTNYEISVTVLMGKQGTKHAQHFMILVNEAIEMC